MKWHFPKIGEFVTPIRSNFFLKKYIPKESTMNILRRIYPEVDWNRVDFYEGLPWWTPAVAPYVTAQALPQFYSFSRFRIYLRKFDESRAQCLADVVHEAFHIMQAMNFARGYGVGFFRLWMLYYIAVFIKHGYRQNAFEVPAYDQEYRFLHYCEKHNLHGITPPVNDEALNALAKEPALVFRKFEFKYREDAVAMAGALFFCTMITILKPLADLSAFLIRPFVPKGKTEQVKKMNLQSSVIEVPENS